MMTGFKWGLWGIIALMQPIGCNNCNKSGLIDLQNSLYSNKKKIGKKYDF